ncbi:MAG TPA: NAD-dependent epimerase/dehydratase family protein [Planctomycetaceae bacterium]|nr:NAD-dependent epimerase/dehydratase family protein [Planctomycetaceae bacterium]
MSSCLITGGAGNLACQLSRVLSERHEKLILVDIAEAPRERLPGNAIYERADLSDEVQVRDAIETHRPGAVIHLASLLSGGCEEDRVRAWRVNCNGTFALFESALEHRVGTVLFTSSVAAFGGELPDPLPEDAPQWPDGLYGVTKMTCERLGVYFHRQHGLDFRCVRLPITISRFAAPGAASSFASHAFIESARHKRFTFRVAPETRLSLIYVQDSIAAMASLLAAPAERLTRRAYSLHAMTVTPREIAAAILKRLPEARITFEPDPAIARLVASWPGAMHDSRARADWGWKPQFDLDQTAKHILDELLG